MHEEIQVCSFICKLSFFKSCFTVAVLKGAGIMPELRDELIRVVRNGRMSREMCWRREEGIRSREQVGALLDVTSVRTSSKGERAEAGKAIRGEGRRRCFLDGHRSK